MFHRAVRWRHCSQQLTGSQTAMGKARMIYYENQQTAEKGQAKGTIDLSQATSVEQVQYCCVVVTTHVVPRTAQRPSKESLFSLSTPLLVISSCKLLRNWKWTNGLLLSARRWLFVVSDAYLTPSIRSLPHNLQLQPQPQLRHLQHQPHLHKTLMTPCNFLQQWPHRHRILLRPCHTCSASSLETRLRIS